MRQIKASIFEATDFALVGEITSVSMDEVQVRCVGPWGSATFEVSPDAAYTYELGECVEVVLR